MREGGVMTAETPYLSQISPELGMFQPVSPAIRSLSDMSEVLRKSWEGPDHALYYMYRQVVSCNADRRWLEEKGIRYDITVIPAANVCGEPAKTLGHYHPANQAGIGFPEVYEVLDGRAVYLLQHYLMKRFIGIKAKRGDIVMIPPGYGHVTINPSKTRQLVMANLVSDLFTSEYGPFRALHGAAYYFLSNGSLEKNMRYPVHPRPEYLAPHAVTPGSIARTSLYEQVSTRNDLDYLNHPEDYRELFTI